VAFKISPGVSLKGLFRSPLYSNALYLMMANIANAIFGFIFWIIVARFYGPGDVGLASAIISAASLLVMLSGLGLNTGLIRFLQSSDSPNKLVNSCFSIAGLVSLLTASIFILGLGLWSPALLFVRQDPLYLAIFILLVPICAFSGLTDSSFVASRRAGFALAKNLVFNILRLSLPIVLAGFFHSFGIFGSWGIAIALAAAAGVFLFLPRVRPGYRPQFAIDRRTVSALMHFSFLNYLGDLFWSVPVYILPVLVVNILSPEDNAYFFMAWAINGILTMIPGTVSTSLLAEGSHEEAKMGQHIRRSLALTFGLLIPAVLLVCLLADKILLLYGNLYSQNAAALLRVLAVSSLFQAVNSLYFATVRVARNMRPLILMSALVAIVTLALAVALLPGLGIAGGGIAWLASQGVIALAVIGLQIKKRWSR
jgi:O-antigen/teichoic acid export membrane protein